jgi:hypothetical protein
MKVHSATCSCIIELYEKWYSFADFFPYFVNFSARNNKAAMGGAGRAQRSDLRVKEPKKTGAGTGSARARTRGQSPQV